MGLNYLIAADLNIPVVTAQKEQLDLDTKPLLPLLSTQRNEIMQLLNKHGAILFRGFSCEDEQYFSQVIELSALGSRCDTSDYDLPRTVLNNDIYTSSDLPAYIPLPLHHEKPRSINPPHHIYFCCVIPPQSGGETVFANAAAIWQDMPTGIREKIVNHGVLYKQFFHGPTSRARYLKKILGNGCVRMWPEYFGTEDKKEIEKKLTQNKEHWQWVNKGRDLVMLTFLPGVVTHPLIQKECWFNSVAYLNYYVNLAYGTLKDLPFKKFLAARYVMFKDLLPMVCHYGDGTPFSADEINAINQVIQKHTHALQWQKGDFMIVDNLTLMHGKQPHQGERLLYSCMTEQR
jgi:alpha-ketoglutarate-dependent taurine dioxygenase